MFHNSLSIEQVPEICLSCMETETTEDTGKHSQTEQTVHFHVLVDN